MSGSADADLQALLAQIGWNSGRLTCGRRGLGGGQTRFRRRSSTPSSLLERRSRTASGKGVLAQVNGWQARTDDRVTRSLRSLVVEIDAQVRRSGPTSSATGKCRLVDQPPPLAGTPRQRRYSRRQTRLSLLSRPLTVLAMCTPETLWRFRELSDLCPGSVTRQAATSSCSSDTRA